MKILKDLIITTENENDFQELTECGYIDVSENAKFSAPQLTTSGYIYVRQNAKFETNFTKKKNYKSVDNTLFIIESEKTSKGIKIYSGYILQKIVDNKPLKKHCFVAEKESFYAHGETVKTAISDLQFKIVAEKLKNDPIKKDTLMTVKYYRLITGACDLGVREFMKQNGLEFNVENSVTVEVNAIKAVELLPILEKNNAYGLGKLKSLLQF